MNKLLMICGPTATGKTSVGVNLSRKFNGEIISADSRQVYKGMDIITGKDLEANSKLIIQNEKLNIHNKSFSVGYRLKNGVPIWLVDVVEPSYPFNVGEYSILARKVITDIWLREKLPIVVGGTGFYIKSIIDPMGGIIIPPNNKLRRELEGKDVIILQQKLFEVDQEKWKRMNKSDRRNSRRLIRAIEIALWRKQNPYQASALSLFKYDSLLTIGLKTLFMRFLYPKIDERVDKRIKKGAIEEVKNLIAKRYSWFLPALTATGARELKDYIEGRETLHEISSRWKFKEHEYARKQITWFKKQKKIKWFFATDEDCGEKIEILVEKWYTQG